MDQNPVGDFVIAFLTGLGAAVGKALVPIGYVLVALAVAAPALSSILLVWTGLRWPLLQRSIAAGAVAGVVLTFVAGAALSLLIVGADAVADLDSFYKALPVLAVVVLAIAFWVQTHARRSFTWARAAGIACAVLVPVIVVLIGELQRA